MFHRMDLATRMTLLVLAGAGSVLCAVVWTSAVRSRRVLEVELEAKARALGAATAYRIEAVEGSVAKACEGLAMAVGQHPPEKVRLEGLLHDLLKGNPGIFGTAAAFEPNVPGSPDPGVAPYLYRTGSTVTMKNLKAKGYQPEIWDWYTLPKRLRRPVWSEPYFDEGGGDILMATYSVPLFGGDGGERFLGVVTSDVSLAWLTTELSSLPLGQAGYAFLISRTGTVIAHPTRQLIMNESIFSLAEERQDPALRELGRRMIRGESGFVSFLSLTTQKPSFLTFSPVVSTGWSLGVVFHKDAVTAQVNALTRFQLLLGMGGLLLLVFVVRQIARSVTRPLHQLDKAVGIMASGDLDAPLPSVKGDDEVAHLTASVARMQTDLKAHIAQLQATTAAKERMARELEIAHTIQMSLVPRTFPPFLGREDFEIYAVLDPAREIGGDLFDFMLLDDDHLCIIIGDVSGKGIPAALFMAVTRSFLRAFFHDERNPAVVFGRLNSELASQGEANMFVTLFAAIIHLPSGEVRFTNGGHNPPYVLRANGTLETLPMVGGIIVGALPGMKYQTGTFKIEPGDTLVMYTDGVTEAQNTAGEFLGEDRTEEALVRLKGVGAEPLVKSMRQHVRAFAEGAEQSDDITIMAFRYQGGEAASRLGE